MIDERGRRRRAGARGRPAKPDALSGVERAYGGMEKAFRIVAAEIDGAVPSGEGGHARLAALMFTPVPGRRPAVLPGALRAQLDELRAFRHRVRNLYGDELIESAVRKRASRTPATVARVRRALRAFEKVLTRAAKRP